MHTSNSIINRIINKVNSKGEAQVSTTFSLFSSQFTLFCRFSKANLHIQHPLQTNIDLKQKLQSSGWSSSSIRTTTNRLKNHNTSAKQTCILIESTFINCKEYARILKNKEDICSSMRTVELVPVERATSIKLDRSI